MGGEAIVRPPGMLWLVSNSWGVDVAGYSLEQMSQASFSGAPAVRFWLNDYNGVGHGLLQLYDDTLVVSASEDTLSNADESWFVFENPNALRGSLLSTNFRRIRVSDFSNWSPGNYGARNISQLMPDPGEDGDVILGRGGYGARVTLAQLYGSVDHTTANVFEATGVGSDTHATDVGQFWICTDGDVFAAIDTADTAVEGAVSLVKVGDGNNLGSASPTGLGGSAMDSTGGFWVMDYGTAAVRYFNAAAIAALNSTPSNPSPTRTLSSPAFNGPETLFQMCMDNDDGLWICTYEEFSRLLYFGAAKLAVGGSQDPDRVITTPIEYGVCPRLNSAIGPHR